MSWRGTQFGMTVREEIAAMALQGILANPKFAQEVSDGQVSATYSQAAVAHADALLEELGNKPRSKIDQEDHL